MHRGEKLRDGGRYAVLAAAYASEAREGTRVDHDAVGGYRTKTVQAGEFLYVSVYPLIGCNADREQRARHAGLRAARRPCPPRP